MNTRTSRHASHTLSRGAIQRGWGGSGTRACLLSVAGVLLLLFIRKPDSFVNPMFWAEDATVFFINQWEDGWSSLWKPYAGYQHFLPRLLAGLGSWLPLSWLPAFYNYSAVAAMLCLSALLFGPRVKLPAKPLLALTLAAVAHPTGEVFANLTNIQWSAALAMIIVLISASPDVGLRRGVGSLLLDGLIVVVAGMTGPFSIVFLALFIARVLHRRDAASGVLACLCLVCAAFQVVFVVQAPLAVEPSGLPLSVVGMVRDSLTVLVHRFVGGMVLPPPLWPTSNVMVMGLLVGTPMLLLGVAVAWCCASQRLAVIYLLGAVALLTAAVLFKFRSNLTLILSLGGGPRYFYIQSVLVMWVVIVGLTSGVARPLRWACAMLLLPMAVTSLGLLFVTKPLPRDDWPAATQRLEAGHDVQCTVNPGWRFTIRAKPRADAPRSP